MFPGLRPDKKGAVTGNWSKWWGRYARQSGITDRRKVFHSFRHTFKDAWTLYLLKCRPRVYYCAASEDPKGRRKWWR